MSIVAMHVKKKGTQDFVFTTVSSASTLPMYIVSFLRYTNLTLIDILGTYYSYLKDAYDFGICIKSANLEY